MDRFSLSDFRSRPDLGMLNIFEGGESSPPPFERFQAVGLKSLLIFFSSSGRMILGLNKTFPLSKKSEAWRKRNFPAEGERIKLKWLIIRISIKREEMGRMENEIRPRRKRGSGLGGRNFPSRN